MDFQSLSNDSPNTAITRKMFELASNHFTLRSPYKRICRKYLLRILEILHIIKPLYILDENIDITHHKTLIINGIKRIILPNEHTNTL